MKRTGALKMLLILALCFTLICPASFAESCEHNVQDPQVTDGYTIITGNESVHWYNPYLAYYCRDCGAHIYDELMLPEEQAHQFGLVGGRITCLLCGYESTAATPTPAPILLDNEYTSGDFKYQLYNNGDAMITAYILNPWECLNQI